MIKQQVRDLASLGWGRRKIASELGISEYKVRSIMRSLVIDKIRKEDTDTFDGRIRLNRVYTRKDKKKIAVVLSDLHVPFHSRSALAICLEYMRDIQPDTIILNGDLIDFYDVSRFLKDPLRIDTLQSELDETRALLNLIRNDHPKAEIYFNRGNHCERLEKFLMTNATALASLRCLSLDELLGLSDNNIVYSDTSVHIGNLEVTHGEVARKLPGSSARGHYERTNSSVLIGHVHKLNVTRQRNKWGVQTLAEGGCLCQLQPEYDRMLTNWQQGFSVVEYSPRTGDFIISQHAISNGEMIVGDKIYRSEEKT